MQTKSSSLENIQEFIPSSKPQKKTPKETKEIRLFIDVDSIVVDESLYHTFLRNILNYIGDQNIARLKTTGKCYFLFYNKDTTKYRELLRIHYCPENCVRFNHSSENPVSEIKLWSKNCKNMIVAIISNNPEASELVSDLELAGNTCIVMCDKFVRPAMKCNVIYDIDDAMNHVSR